MRVYIFIQVPDTFQAHTSDRHVLNEELEDPLKVPLSESPRNPYQGLEGFIKVEEKGWEPVNDSQSLMRLQRIKRVKVFSSSKFPTFAPFGNFLMQIRHQNLGECAELGYVCQGEN